LWDCISRNGVPALCGGKLMEIKLPYKVDMSVNQMYWTSRRGKFLKKEAIMLRARIMEDVKEQIKPFEISEMKSEIVDAKLTIGIIMTENWYCKNGSVKKADLDNRLKFLIDSVFRGLNLDDRMIFEIYAKKEQSELAECVSIDIREWQEDLEFQYS